MTRPAPIIAGTLAVLLLLLGAYMGAYYMLLEPYVTMEYADGSRGPAYYDLNHSNTYGPGDQLVDCFFWPAHLIDRRLRSRWN